VLSGGGLKVSTTSTSSGQAPKGIITSSGQAPDLSAVACKAKVEGHNNRLNRAHRATFGYVLGGGVARPTRPRALIWT
jgi:hypothetical protein